MARVKTNGFSRYWCDECKKDITVPFYSTEVNEMYTDSFDLCSMECAVKYLLEKQLMSE